jgi:TatD DNase family protein
LIDTHCHLYQEEFKKDIEIVIQDATAIGVKKIFVPGVDAETSQRSLEIASKFPNTVFPMVGIHPNYSSENKFQIIEELILSRRNQIIAVGEIGLDYYREFSPRASQINTFEKMLSLARKFDLPICIHNRDADKDILSILGNWYSEKVLGSSKKIAGIFHAYSGSRTIAEFGIANGFAFGIGGPVTYKNSHQLRENIRNIGLNNLVLETDAPYLSPNPYRGKRNEPKYIQIVLNTLSKVFELPIQQIEERTDENAERLFLKRKMP